MGAHRGASARPTHRRQRGASRVRAVDLPFPLLTADLARSPESPAIRASHRSHLTGPELWHAWQLTQPLVRVYEADDEASARALLKEFVARYAELPIPEFKTILKLLAQWLPEILAFHSCDRITNGRLEGVNNKLGVLKRTAYGFKNPRNFEARALLICPAVA